MLFNWLFQFISSAVGALITAIPAPSVPSWLSGLAGDVSSIASSFAGFGVWFPVTLIVPVLTAIGAAYLVAVSAKVMRIVSSYMTGGGGSAG